jgi:hypothetical protein
MTSQVRLGPLCRRRQHLSNGDSQEELDLGNRNSLCGIIYCAHEFADPDYQQRVWVEAKGPEVSWYEDALSDLFDGFDVERFLDGSASKYGFSDEMTDRLSKFVRTLDAFDRQLPEGIDNEALIQMPTWLGVNAAAASFLDSAVSWLEANSSDYPMMMWSWGGKTFGR